MDRLTYFAQQVLDPSKLPNGNADPATLGNILDLLFKIIGAIALLFLVIAGFRYVISSGEPQKAAEARRQIIYIFVGLVVAVLADVIVTFVVNKAG